MKGLRGQGRCTLSPALPGRETRWFCLLVRMLFREQPDGHVVEPDAGMAL